MQAEVGSQGLKFMAELNWDKLFRQQSRYMTLCIPIAAINALMRYVYDKPSHNHTGIKSSISSRVRCCLGTMDADVSVLCVRSMLMMPSSSSSSRSFASFYRSLEVRAKAPRHRNAGPSFRLGAQEILGQVVHILPDQPARDPPFEHHRSTLHPGYRSLCHGVLRALREHFEAVD